MKLRTRRTFIKSVEAFYTFDNYVVSRGNKLVHRACLDIATYPGKFAEHIPLYIYNADAVGKTHLLHAIGNHIKKHSAHLNVCYVSAATFKKADQEKYDVLLVDDVSSIVRSRSAQSELLQLINSFVSNGKQIVIASNRAPKEIVGLNPALRLLFEGGAVATFQPLPLDTKKAILDYKAKASKLVLDQKTKDRIARKYNSIRGMEMELDRIKIS